MRQVFGVCANEYSPSDGQVVSLDHGCGAHSEASVLGDAAQSRAPFLDELGFDVITLTSVEQDINDNGVGGEDALPEEFDRP